MKDNKVVILDHPYVSLLLEKAIISMKIPVYKNAKDLKLKLESQMNIINYKSLAQILKEKSVRVYLNSENSLDILYKNLSNQNILKATHIFKDKYLFRKTLSDYYPNFEFFEVEFDKLGEIDLSNFHFPLIVKPSTGFFSIGIYKISNKNKWGYFLKKLSRDLKQINTLYPPEVINPKKILIESYIPGDEYAIDAYYNSDGKPVILNIFSHAFRSKNDLRDIIYYTNGQIIRKVYYHAIDFLKKLNKKLGIKNYPMHLEMRTYNGDTFIPIEINPMRFAGWCTTDIAYFAYKINVYECFFKGEEPNWENILKNCKNETFGFIILHMPSNILPENIKSINWKKMRRFYNNIIDIRKIDYTKYPLLAILFVKVKKAAELNRYFELESEKFIELKQGRGQNVRR